MLKKILDFDAPKITTPQEGDLSKIIRLRGSTFEIRYGFYEECDRHSRYAEPMEIYPNFRKEPQYTDDGMPFVTAIQDPCKDFSGPINENSTCEECVHYCPGEELIGICTHPEKHHKNTARRILP